MNATRNITQKVLLSEAEQARLLELSAASRRQRGPLIRELIDAAYCDLQVKLQAAAPRRQTNSTAARIAHEGPRHGHFAIRRIVLPNARGAIGPRVPHLRV